MSNLYCATFGRRHFPVMQCEFCAYPSETLVVRRMRNGSRKRGKWRRNEGKSKRGRWKIENGRRKSFKMRRGPFFFLSFFLLFKATDICFGPTKLGIFCLRKNSPREKSSKMTLPRLKILYMVIRLCLRF